MRIEPYDVRTADEATTLAYADFFARARATSSPLGLPIPRAHALNLIRHGYANQPVHARLAYDGDEIVAAIAEFWWEEPDNRDRAWVYFDVRPGWHADDVVDALAAEAAAIAAPFGRTVLNVDVLADSALSAWVRARGGTLGSVEEHNVVRFADVDRADLAALAARPPGGYELIRVDGPMPDDLVPAYVQLVRTMNEAPRDDLTMEDWSFTPERLRTWEAGLAARGHVLWTVIAREVATGELAAFNQLVVRPEWPEVIENEDTAVVGAHRGHGLGLYVKAVNLLRVVDERPETVCVSTWNAASNTHMLRVNRRLGFVCEHRWEAWELPADRVAR